MTVPKGVYLPPDFKAAAVGRHIICLAKGEGPAGAAQMAAEYCRSTPQNLRTFELHEKAAVGAGSTAGTGWGAELSASGIGREGFAYLISRGSFGRLTSFFRRVSFRTKFPRDAFGGVAGARRSEGMPKPVARTTFDTMELLYSEFVALVIATMEVVRFGSEEALTNTVIDGVNSELLGQLIDPAITGAITANAVSVTATGTTAAAITTDHRSMIAAAGTPLVNPVAAMRPSSYYSGIAALAGAGSVFPVGTWFGIPAVLDAKMPQSIVLIDGASIAFATDENLVLDTSRQTSIEMSDAPTQSGIAGTGAATVSLYQTNMIAISASLGVAWAATTEGGSPSQPQGVVTMAISY